MVYRRMVYEALTMISYVAHACDDRLLEAARELEELVESGAPPEAFLELASRLREAAYVLREVGCLEWSQLILAADAIEQAV